MKKHLLTLSLALVTLAVPVIAAKPIPTILSTDLGTDIDDTWALAHILKSPELDLKMVLTETGDAIYRGKLTAKFLEVTGNTDVAVAIGLNDPRMPEARKTQKPWVVNYDLNAYPGKVHADGIQAVINFIKDHKGPVNVIAIGPTPSLAQVLRQAPEIAEKCHFFGMHGSFDLGYGGSPTPSAEYNVKADPEAFRVVIGANWKSSAITPLDTCGLFSIKGDNYRRIWCAMDDPMIQALIENYCIWAPLVPWTRCDYFAERSSTLFDDVAVYMAYSGEYLNYEEITFSVTDDGFTRRDPDGPFTAKVAISWKDMDAFERFLTDRLLNSK